MLAGHGDETAFISETDEERQATRISRRELLIESRLQHMYYDRAWYQTGCRVAVYLPNDLHAVARIEAAKRLVFVHRYRGGHGKLVACRQIDGHWGKRACNERQAGRGRPVGTGC